MILVIAIVGGGWFASAVRTFYPAFSAIGSRGLRYVRYLTLRRSLPNDGGA